MQAYTPQWFEKRRAGARRSAEAMVPLVLELTRPRSVIDVGCGQGGWLAVFAEHGVDDILGVDGAWVETEQLEIPATRFLRLDLTVPLRLDRKFDLVVSLEVAEHLPEEAAQTFVDSLTSLGDVVLFSAAIPFQGGNHHVNEQWQDYWVERFLKNDYVAIDCIRSRIWTNEKVAYYYAQNTLLYARRSVVSERPDLLAEFEQTRASLLSLVHPVRYGEILWERRVLEARLDIAS